MKTISNTDNGQEFPDYNRETLMSAAKPNRDGNPEHSVVPSRTDRLTPEIPARSQSAEILPCPFCGRVDRLRLMVANWCRVVNCWACDINGPPVAMSVDRDLAWERWNKRAGQTDSQGHVGE